MSESHWLYWRCYQLDHGDEENALTVRATSPASAAEVFADERDWSTNEYAIVGGRDAVICVCASHGMHWKQYKVTGRSIREYTATPIT